jgi:hypothetical protein
MGRGTPRVEHAVNLAWYYKISKREGFKKPETGITAWYTGGAAVSAKGVSVVEVE